MDVDIRSINEKIERESAFVDILTAEMNKVRARTTQERFRGIAEGGGAGEG